MALLTLKKRKEYFKKLGLGEYNRANILRFQKKYMLRPSDWDGIYGKNTDTLLRHCINVSRTQSFRPEEFVCGCRGRYCCGYPDRMKVKELEHIQRIHDHYKKPMVVTSGLRCKRFNAELNGHSNQSRHMTGYAVDFYMPGETDNIEHRQGLINYAKTLKNHHYTYGNGCRDSNGVRIVAPNMGNAVHTDVR